MAKRTNQMANELRFDNRVAIVTGAGGGLGRTYALLLASRGAAVVVNDLGGSTQGEGKSNRAADLVVEEIKKNGGKAVANYDSVEDGAKIVQTAIDAFGRIDIVINNAGILRDVSFQKMTDKDWDLVYRVHLKGSYSVSKAAWPYLRDQGYGRIIMTASAVGLYGNFGQANYGACKLGLVGLGKALAIEGEKRNVFVNIVAPSAKSRMTESLLPPDLSAELTPECVAPIVAYLCHESNTHNGEIIEVAGGWIAQVQWQRSRGKYFGAEISAEKIAENWDQISDFENADHPKTSTESVASMSQYLTRSKL
eukprot:TRINITY_DN1213_c1_g1_i1.p1 TRINITY_DN1213_c1_g1~~TRINITY_DN1213_c1_g1_i1.p1  ORF type:complete len:309 (-),score=108.91 TRINITY_DN1213_c1_g1_i1:83-1009(-)